MVTDVRAPEARPVPWPTHVSTARSAAMQRSTDDLGRPLPPSMQHTDHVHVYTSNLSLSLGSSDQNNMTRAFDASGSAALIDPPLSPGPPLRGYAAVPLATQQREKRRADEAREHDAQYQQMMQSILERTRQQNQAQEQDEDRRVERLLKHIANEQEFVEQVCFPCRALCSRASSCDAPTRVLTARSSRVYSRLVRSWTTT